jgi:hypothetical protein
MRARRVGTGSEFRLFQGEHEIGRVDETTVSFLGFATREDAALAASVAHLALTRRRGGKPQSASGPSEVLVMDHGSSQAAIAPAGALATLLPPTAEDSEIGSWGFEIRLLPEEGIDIFAIARARVMWHALRNTGVYRRMQKFHADRLATTTSVHPASRVQRAVVTALSSWRGAEG